MNSAELACLCSARLNLCLRRSQSVTSMTVTKELAPTSALRSGLHFNPLISRSKRGGSLGVVRDLLRARRTSNMLREDPDDRASNHGAFIAGVGRTSFNRFAQAQELGLSLGRPRPSLARELVNSDAANFTLDRLALVQHGKFEGNPLHIVTQNPAPHERHLDPHIRRIRTMKNPAPLGIKGRGHQETAFR